MIIQRSIYPQLQAHVKAKQISLITGARQVGKTTILRQLYKELKDQNEIVYLLNMDDPTIASVCNTHPNNIFNFVREIPTPILEGKAESTIYLLLDEIQNLSAPSTFLKLLYDLYAPNIKLIVTGSSAFYIDKKFNDSLAGRKRIFELFSFSFQEYLIAQQLDELLNELAVMQANPGYHSLKMVHLQNELLQYMTYGGYPDVVLADSIQEKKAILTELQTSYIKRDMLESGVDKPDKFYALFALLANQIGTLVNKSELSNTLQMNRSTIDFYLFVMQKSYHIKLIQPFFNNLRKELTKMPKVYFRDLGLRNSFANNFFDIANRSDKGSILENYVFTKLAASDAIKKIQFWRKDQKEIDFIVTDEHQKAYEVKWSGNTFRPSKYRNFSKHYPIISVTGISFDGEGVCQSAFSF